MIIVIEGIDQAGKKSQSILLGNALKKMKIKTTVFSFPDYSTPIGKEIQKYLHGKRKFTKQTIHCLLAANRWEKLEEIQKANSKNSVVIMNRYYQSNLVYGMTNGLSYTWLENLDAGLPRASLVIVLDLKMKDSFVRKNIRRDRFEQNKNFEKKISENYRKLAKKYKWKLIDASQTKSQVHEIIMNLVQTKLSKIK